MADDGDGRVDLRASLDRWVADTPTLTRGLTAGLVFAFVLGVSIGNWAVATVPYYVVSRFQVYRLFVSPLFEGSALGLLFTLYWLNRWGAAFEQDHGTRAFALCLVRLGVAINIVFCAVALALAHLVGVPSLVVAHSQGFFPIMVCLLVLHPPRGNLRFAFIPLAIPPAYAPYAIVALSALISGRVPLDLVCAIAVGHLFRVLRRLNFAAPPLPQFISQMPLSQPRRNGWLLVSGSDHGSDAQACRTSPKPSRTKLFEAAQARLKGNESGVTEKALDGADLEAASPQQPAIATPSNGRPEPGPGPAPFEPH